MRGLLIGDARVADDTDDRTAQRNALIAFGVGADRVYPDTGMAGASRDRPGWRKALAVCRAGNTLVLTALFLLARSGPDARDLITELASRQVTLNLAGTSYDPTDPLSNLLSDVLGLVANRPSRVVQRLLTDSRLNGVPLLLLRAYYRLLLADREGARHAPISPDPFEKPAHRRSRGRGACHRCHRRRGRRTRRGERIAAGPAHRRTRRCCSGQCAAR